MGPPTTLTLNSNVHVSIKLGMAADFEAAFAMLKPVPGKYAKRLSVKSDTPTEYTLVTKSPSPFPQHKGRPMYFGSVRLEKAYVNFHLMPLYMNAALTKSILPGDVYLGQTGTRLRSLSEDAGIGPGPGVHPSRVDSDAVQNVHQDSLIFWSV
jgi:hypothetical protein